jgi:hypothetical protein
MNVALRLLALWFVVSILFGILLGKALKVLGRQGPKRARASPIAVHSGWRRNDRNP